MCDWSKFITFAAVWLEHLRVQLFTVRVREVGKRSELTMDAGADGTEHGLPAAFYTPSRRFG
jgi:hypothetical protein